LASKIKGANLLCAHGWAGQTQLPYWRRISQSEIRKIAAAKKEAAKARAGKNSFPPTPFLFARPSGKVLIKIQSPDFRQKKFGFRPTNTTDKNPPS
jgi:hypothetical protein